MYYFEESEEMADVDWTRWEKDLHQPSSLSEGTTGAILFTFLVLLTVTFVGLVVYGYVVGTCPGNMCGVIGF